MQAIANHGDIVFLVLKDGDSVTFKPISKVDTHITFQVREPLFIMGSLTTASVVASDGENIVTALVIERDNLKQAVEYQGREITRLSDELKAINAKSS